MSEENVERFRGYIERFNRGDIEGALHYAHPEIRFEHRLVELQGEATGIDAVRDWFVDARNLFDRWTVDCDDFRDLGDRVLALGSVRALGKCPLGTNSAHTRLVRSHPSDHDRRDDDDQSEGDAMNRLVAYLVVRAVAIRELLEPNARTVATRLGSERARGRSSTSA